MWLHVGTNQSSLPAKIGLRVPSGGALAFSWTPPSAFSVPVASGYAGEAGGPSLSCCAPWSGWFGPVDLVLQFLPAILGASSRIFFLLENR